MAIVTLTPVQVTDLGTTVSLEAANADGNDFLNQDERTFLRVQNTSGASVTVTFRSQKNCDQGHRHDETRTVAAGTTQDLGSWKMARYNDVNGKVVVNYSSVTGVNVAAVRLS